MVAQARRDKGLAPIVASKSGEPICVQEPAEMGLMHLRYTLGDVERNCLSTQRQLERLDSCEQQSWGLFADATFLVLAAWNTFRSATRLEPYDSTGKIKAACKLFLAAQPDLQGVRNMLEHLDDRRMGEVQGKNDSQEVQRGRRFSENPIAAPVRSSVASLFSHDGINAMSVRHEPSSPGVNDEFESESSDDLIFITNLRQYNLSQLVRDVVQLAGEVRSDRLRLVLDVLEMTHGEWVDCSDALKSIEMHPEYWKMRLNRWNEAVEKIANKA